MNQERIMSVLLAPHVSEKTTLVADRYKQVVFKVLRDASKEEIKIAVETMFSVKVETVRTVNVKGKTRNFRQKAGKRSDWKKAYVSLADGQELNFMGKEN